MKIAFKNLEDDPIVVTMSFVAGCKPTQPRYGARAFLNPDGTLNSSHNEAVDAWQTSASTVQLERRESSVIDFVCKSQTVSSEAPAGTVTRRLRYYSDTTGVEVPTTRTVAFRVPIASVPAKCFRVVLRIGVSQDFSSNASFPYDSPAAKWNPPRIQLNGHAPIGAATRLWHDAKIKPKAWTNVWHTFEYDFAGNSLLVNDASQSVVATLGEEIQLGGLTISTVALDVYSQELRHLQSPLKTTDEEIAYASAGRWRGPERLRSLDGLARPSRLEEATQLHTELARRAAALRQLYGMRATEGAPAPFGNSFGHSSQVNSRLLSDK